MANFVYTRIINGTRYENTSDTFFHIATMMVQELDSNPNLVFLSIEGLVEGRYCKWADRSVVKQILRLIEQACCYRHFFLADTLEKKDHYFQKYITFKNNDLDLRYAEYPWNER